jgi:hypothetical protein
MHYNPKELAALWGFSTVQFRSLFERMAGVIILNGPATLNKQRDRRIKIPASVAQREHAQMVVPLR